MCFLLILQRSCWYSVLYQWIGIIYEVWDRKEKFKEKKRRDTEKYNINNVFKWKTSLFSMLPSLKPGIYLIFCLQVFFISYSSIYFFILYLWYSLYTLYNRWGARKLRVFLLLPKTFPPLETELPLQWHISTIYRVFYLNVRNHPPRGSLGEKSKFTPCHPQPQEPPVIYDI